MKLLNSYVLIKPYLDTSIELAGKKFEIDTTYEIEKHAPTEGEVMAVPDRLVFNMEPRKRSVDFDVDMELKVGDKVYFHYLTRDNCIRDGRVVYDDDDNPMYMVEYDQIFTAVREDDIVPINGWNLVELLEGDIVKSDVLEIPDALKNKGSVKFAKVAHMASPVRRYKRFPQESDCDTISEGDVVAYSKNSDIPVQYAYYNTLGKKKKFRRMQRRDIFAIIPKSELDKVQFV